MTGGADGSAEPFVEMLRGATNSLGRTEEVVALVLNDHDRLDEVHQLFFQDDEWVRLRASSSWKRIWRAQPEWAVPYLDSWIGEVSKLDQPSVQWTFAQLCLELDDLLTPRQRSTARNRLKKYLESSDDWIVLNSTMPTLTHWAADRAELAEWLRPRLDRLASDDRKSVATRAAKALKQLDS